MITISGQAVLLDIEGTTSSVSYVYDVLFPFAREHLSRFLDQHWDEPDVRHACTQIAKDAGADSWDEWIGSAGKNSAQQQVQTEVERLMDGDVKATGLKELQGLIWRDGFQSGQLKAHVYDDVPPLLKNWDKAGLHVAIYSSGSVTAQKLFFGHTIHGDLTQFLDGHFDTTTGPKKDQGSYCAIADQCKIPAKKWLFLSDVVAELDAARDAGMKTGLVLRPGNPPVDTNHNHPTLSSFTELK